MKVNKKPKEAILFLYEGDTEGGFYDKLFTMLELNGKVQLKRKCINGIYNINNKIRKAIESYLENEKNAHVKYLSVFVAYDREGNREEVESRLDKQLITEAVGNNRLKKIEEIIATQMLESWFFIDIEGIYNFLKMPASKRMPHKYKNFEKFRHEDLHALFKEKNKNGKYIKGNGCIDLINSLDLNKILKECDDLQQGVNKIIGTAGLKKL